MKKASIFGILGSLALLSLYFLVMRLGSGSWDYTVRELVRLKFWVAPLVIGFGTQVGLFTYLKNCSMAKTREKGATVVGVTTSSVAMLACCAHHVTDVLPIVGLSAATVFLVKYQQWFLALGILSNAVGVLIMIRQIREMKR